MKSLMLASLIFLLSSMSYGKCKQAVKELPAIPDPSNVTFKELAKSKAQVGEYLVSSQAYLGCAKGAHRTRAEKAIKNSRKLIAQYNKASAIFAERAKHDPSLLPQKTMIASN